MNTFISLGILIFERVRQHSKSDLVPAIMRCSLATAILLDIIPPCVTLQETCSIIETNHILKELKNILKANVKTYFDCPSCRRALDSLATLTEQLFIFKSSSKNKIMAHPVVSLVDTIEHVHKCCTHYDQSKTNLKLHINKQILFKCPTYLIVGI